MTQLRGQQQAFGPYGTRPRWTQGNKDGVGTAYSTASRVWFTLWNGVLTELYYPTIDRPQTRDLQYLVTLNGEFQSEKQLQSTTERMWTHALGYRVTNRDPDGRFKIVKEIIASPLSSCVLQQTHITGDDAIRDGLKLYVLCAPHVDVAGWGNTAEILTVAGRTMLVATRNGTWLAIVATVPLVRASAGYVGSSDGWQDLNDNAEMNYQFDRAVDGNTALMAEVDWQQTDKFTLGIGFGDCRHAAITTVLQALYEPFEQQKEKYQQQWEPPCCNETRTALEEFAQDDGALYYTSLSLLMAHEDKTYHGALIASLAIPWGHVKGDDEEGGYHLVWVRDMVNSARGLLAAGNQETPLRALIYLAASQQNNGGFPQNFWINGDAHWCGVQLDQVALPIILAYTLYCEDALRDFDPYPMVQRAASFLVLHGPATQQERWEEASGYSPSTLATSIAALICAAHFARLRDDVETAAFLEEYADFLEDHIETWTVTTEGSLVADVPRHFIRVLPADMDDPTPCEDPNSATLYIINRPQDDQAFPAKDVVDAGFLELVRYGIRSPHDPLIVDSLKVVDAALRTKTPSGIGWHRYNHDGYGQKADGSAFDGTGVGRIWPLLTGERAHYELAAGHDITPLIESIEGFATETGMLPEQSWDAEDIPEAHMHLGRPTGSAMPLMWAHSEYVKLLRSRSDNRVFDHIPELAERYQNAQDNRRYLEIWKPNRRVAQMKSGYELRVQAPGNFTLRWWTESSAKGDDHTQEATLTPVGIAYIDISAESAKEIEFEFVASEEKTLRSARFAVQVKQV
ncbi:MAG: glycoside hydrolase family 15 protein [Elainellaceae cyanobacterium]